MSFAITLTTIISLSALTISTITLAVKLQQSKRKSSEQTTLAAAQSIVQGKDLIAIGAKMEAVATRVDSIDNRLARMEGSFQMLSDLVRKNGNH